MLSSLLTINPSRAPLPLQGLLGAGSAAAPHVRRGRAPLARFVGTGTGSRRLKHRRCSSLCQLLFASCLLLIHCFLLGSPVHLSPRVSAKKGDSAPPALGVAACRPGCTAVDLWPQSRACRCPPDRIIPLSPSSEGWSLSDLLPSPSLDPGQEPNSAGGTRRLFRRGTLQVHQCLQVPAGSELIQRA